MFAGDVSTKIIYQIPHLNDRNLQRDPGRTSFTFVVLIINDKETGAIDTYYIIKKSNRRLYALRKLKACGVQDGELVAVYCSLLRAVLEYASVVFANLPQYLSKALERVQKRALRIIFGLDLSYEDTLVRAGLLSLEARRHLACNKFVTETMHASLLYRLISRHRFH